MFEDNLVNSSASSTSSPFLGPCPHPYIRAEEVYFGSMQRTNEPSQRHHLGLDVSQKQYPRLTLVPNSERSAAGFETVVNILAAGTAMV